MAEAAFLERLVAAEEGRAVYPDSGFTGLRAEAARLDRAEGLVFAEGEGLDDFFSKLVDLPKQSPLAPRAERLRLLRAHREGLKRALSGENPRAGRLFGALAAGPGPTLTKRIFEQGLDDRAQSDSVSALRRALSKEARPVYDAERAWLKKVGPSRMPKGHWPGDAREWLRKNGRNTILTTVMIVVSLWVIVSCVTSFSSGGGGRSSHIPYGGIGVIIWLIAKRLRS